MPWDEKLPSDADVEGMNEQELDHRLNIVWDLEDSFLDNAWQSGVWGGLALVYVCAGLFFGWIDDDKVLQTLAIASIIVIACAGIWGHSLYWRNRFKRRRKFLLRQQDRIVPVDNELSDEENERFASLVQLVKMKCQYAQSIAEDIASGMGDDYDREQVEKFITTALGHADEIEDEYYRSAALHLITELLVAAGQITRAKDLIGQISVEFIREQAEETVVESGRTQV